MIITSAANPATIGTNSEIFTFAMSIGADVMLKNNPLVGF